VKSKKSKKKKKNKNKNDNDDLLAFEPQQEDTNSNWLDTEIKEPKKKKKKSKKKKLQGNVDNEVTEHIG